MNCKNCLHHDVCKMKQFPKLFGLTGEFCDCFKDKSRYVELPLEVIKNECGAVSSSNAQCCKCCAYCDKTECKRRCKNNPALCGQLNKDKC